MPFRSWASKILVSDLMVPLKIRMVEYFMFDFGSKPTRKTSPASGPAGSGCNSVVFSPSISTAEAGEGAYLTIISRSSVTPTSVRALVKTIGIIVPVLRAFTNTEPIFSEVIFSPPR